MELGRRLGRACSGGSVIALVGKLAAGKTTLAKGIALGLGVEEDVLSPTFTLINEYPGRLTLHHMDAYRLGGTEDFLRLGADEIMDGGGVSVIEWADIVERALPSSATRVRIEVLEDGSRSFEIEGPLETALAAAFAETSPEAVQ